MPKNRPSQLRTWPCVLICDFAWQQWFLWQWSLLVVLWMENTVPKCPNSDLFRNSNFADICALMEFATYCANYVVSEVCRHVPIVVAGWVHLRRENDKICASDEKKCTTYLTAPLCLNFSLSIKSSSVPPINSVTPRDKRTAGPPILTCG